MCDPPPPLVGLLYPGPQSGEETNGCITTSAQVYVNHHASWTFLPLTTRCGWSGGSKCTAASHTYANTLCSHVSALPLQTQCRRGRVATSLLSASASTYTHETGIAMLGHCILVLCYLCLLEEFFSCMQKVGLSCSEIFQGACGAGAVQVPSGPKWSIYGILVLSGACWSF